MNSILELESGIQALERLLGTSVTIIDNRGSLHDGAGRNLFPGKRQSHRKNAICETGFCHKCVENCRYRSLERAAKTQAPYFASRCWKGAMELVFPLRTRGGFCAGLLYAGIWREPGREEPRNAKLLPPEAREIYAALPEFDKAEASQLASALLLFRSGLAAELERLRLRSGAEPSERLALIKEHVFECASEPVSLARLGAKLGLSPSRAGHATREVFGRGLEALVMEERMNRACSLLSSSSLPLGELAALAGFPDQFSFSRQFKSRTGLSPGAYRRRFSEGPR